MEFKIQTINNIEKLEKLFYFLSKTFYKEATENGHKYELMYERFNEMKNQFVLDRELLLYIEHNNEIIAGLTIKNRNEKDEATLGMIAVDKQYRMKGIGEMLVNFAEKECSKKGIKTLYLGARTNAINFYQKMGYKASLMIQIFDFETIENIKRVNDNYKNYLIINEFSDVAYGFVFFEIDKVDIEDIKYFEDNLDVCSAQFVFNKPLNEI